MKVAAGLRRAWRAALPAAALTFAAYSAASEGAMAAQAAWPARRAAGALAADALAAGQAMPPAVQLPPLGEPVPPLAAREPFQCIPYDQLPRLPRELDPAGRPGDVRLLTMSTNLTVQCRELLPVFFFRTRAWLAANRYLSHGALDWMDEHGQWWHTELRHRWRHPEEYAVGSGGALFLEVPIYHIFILPGRSDPEDAEVLDDRKIECDHRLILQAAHRYARHDRCYGDPDTNGDGSRNAGLGGPIFELEANCQTYICYLLRSAGVDLPPPVGAVGWGTQPVFPHTPSR